MKIQQKTAFLKGNTMNIKFKEDKNGKIADNDPIFDTLNEQIDNEEYAAVVSKITSIPREKWSNKLRFLLICAYNNQHDFEKADNELNEVEELCETPNDKARYCYQRGYKYSATGMSVMAHRFFSDVLKHNPEYAKSIDIESEIADCEEEIRNDLANLHELCKKLFNDIKRRCAENSVKRKLNAEEFRTRLGFFSSIRKLPDFERAMGFGDYSARLEGEDKEKTLKWFSVFFDITDTESFFEHIQTYRGCNLARMAVDSAAFLAGKPNFDINELNEGGKFAFGNTVMFVDQFVEYLPRGGVLAWDINEKIGYVRHAYRCGILKEDEYNRCMSSLSEMAADAFSSWEEYMRSLICGAALFVYSIDQWNIKSAVDFASKMAPLMLSSDLADVSWGE